MFNLCPRSQTHSGKSTHLTVNWRPFIFPTSLDDSEFQASNCGVILDFSLSVTPYLHTTGNLPGFTVKICPKSNPSSSPPLFSCWSEPPSSPTRVIAGSSYEIPCSHPCPQAGLSQFRVILLEFSLDHVTLLM